MPNVHNNTPFLAPRKCFISQKMSIPHVKLNSENENINITLFVFALGVLKNYIMEQ